MSSGLVPEAGMQKEDVNYRQHEKCKLCQYFYPLNSCEIVMGNISPDAVCDKWEIMEKKEPMDGESYMAEFRKVNPQ